MKQNEPIEEKKQEKEEVKSLLEEIIREGARKLLVNNGIYTFFAISFVSSFIFSILNISFEVPSYFIIFFIFTSVFITDAEKEKLKSANKPVSYIVFCFIIILLASSFFFTSRAGLADKSIQRVIVNSCV